MLGLSSSILRWTNWFHTTWYDFTGRKAFCLLWALQASRDGQDFPISYSKAGMFSQSSIPMLRLWTIFLIYRYFSTTIGMVIFMHWLYHNHLEMGLTICVYLPGYSLKDKSNHCYGIQWLVIYWYVDGLTLISYYYAAATFISCDNGRVHQRSKMCQYRDQVFVECVQYQRICTRSKPRVGYSNVLIVVDVC
jgi:hypothetical protein